MRTKCFPRPKPKVPLWLTGDAKLQARLISFHPVYDPYPDSGSDDPLWHIRAYMPAPHLWAPVGPGASERTVRRGAAAFNALSEKARRDLIDALNGWREV